MKLYEATTAYAEVEYAAAQIRQMLSRGYRCRDIAVTARNLEEYGPLLEHIFARDSIPVYMSRRSDILQKPPLLLILGALDAVTGGFEYEDMFRYLKTGLAGIDRAECDTLENYVVLWGIRGKMWLRDVAWTANPDGYGADMTPERQARLDEINTIREKVRLPLLALYESMGAPSAAVKKRRLCTALLSRQGCRSFCSSRCTTSWRPDGCKRQRNTASYGKFSAACWTSLRRSWAIRL